MGFTTDNAIKNYRKRNRDSSDYTLPDLIKHIKRAIDQMELFRIQLLVLTDDLVFMQQHKQFVFQIQEDGPLHKAKKYSYDFTREDEFVVVYTDGVCENSGTTYAKAGIGVWFGSNHPLNISEGVYGKPTNNTVEIQACVYAIKAACLNGVTKLKIKTNSQFVINSITNWIYNWKKNDLKVASGGAVENEEDIIVLDNTIKILEKVVWEYVDGHKGILGNEEANKLARAGATRNE